MTTALCGGGVREVVHGLSKGCCNCGLFSGLYSQWRSAKRGQDFRSEVRASCDLFETVLRQLIATTERNSVKPRKQDSLVFCFHYDEVIFLSLNLFNRSNNQSWNYETWFLKKKNIVFFDKKWTGIPTFFVLFDTPTKIRFEQKIIQNSLIQDTMNKLLLFCAIRRWLIFCKSCKQKLTKNRNSFSVDNLFSHQIWLTCVPWLSWRQDTPVFFSTR